MSRAAPKLKANSHPLGIGMSNELDSNMALIALMQCFGSYIQNAEARVTLNTKATRDAVNFMASLYRRGMVSDVFAWVPASNNNAMLAGRISLAMNAISIMRTAELQNPSLARNLAIAPIPKGKQRLGLEHVMGVYTIWKFAANKRLAKKFLLDMIVPTYNGHFLNSKFYNFPCWPGAVKNIKQKLNADPSGKYGILDTISRTATTNVGHPGVLERGDRRGVHCAGPGRLRTISRRSARRPCSAAAPARRRSRRRSHSSSMRRG